MAYSHDQIDGPEHRLFVLNGELRGVSVPLSEAPLRVGSSDDCDVILFDEDQCGAEVTITATGNRLRLVEGTGDVRVGLGHVKPGKSRTVKSGVPFKVGSAELMITQSLADADRAQKAYHKRSSKLAFAASFALLVGLVGLVAYTGGRGSVVAQPAPVALKAPSSKNNPSFSAVIAANAMQAKLDESGLTRLAATPDRLNGTVKVRGKVLESQRSVWREASTWFDTKYGTTVMLDAEINMAPATVTLPFSVTAVWMGNTPRLTLHDGSQSFAGDLLPGGWRLDVIESNSVTISRDGESLTVPL